ncbi:subunit of tubulin prefoldin [Puttea exsequens]|nr:subunit of tubulin prefoldin [Puttea exsequens]
MTSQQPQQIDLSSLPIPQLNSVKNQLTQELQHLTGSFSALKQAEAKFRDCGRSVGEGVRGGEGTPILVPLTPSLYVPGKLASTETVLVDIGTGFYVEKTPPAAQDFYKRKVEELGKNLVDLEKIVQGKQGNLTVVEDVLRQKVIAESAKGGGDGGT